LFNSDQLFINTIIFIVGLCFGSFLNVIIYRLPEQLSLVSPPSRCPACSKKLGFVELLPVIGYLLIRGRCRQCNIIISPRYPVIELVTGLLFLFTYFHFSFSLEFFIYLTLLFILFGIAMIDLAYRIVPNSLVATGLIAGFLFYLPGLVNYLIDLPAWIIAQREPLDALYGMLLGGGILLIIFLVSRGGMGAGDLKLIILIGFYVGLRGTALVLLLGFMMGALIGVTFMILGKLTRKDALPFAPFLSLAALIEIFQGEQIWDWYINLL